ncbi:MAG: methylmalonyl-CoA carboxyltransferase, partial [Candidatus Dormibacteraeota bacterium]|nr:methylmalonyl-CoA carboxyltransferase [Candidatus Dormibacteraeota bacterium]
MTEDRSPDSLAGLVDDLHTRRQRALAMGGEERVQQQHDKGKLTARERVTLLFDEGTFVESGLLA